jgi:phosphohistidine swiveling domain-containing protein
MSSQLEWTEGNQASELVQSLADLPAEQWLSAGGKGGTLARLYQAGYPVPDGFVILPGAFDGDTLKPAVWPQVQVHLERLLGLGEAVFAVRSSALCEDSALASFAGEFETVLGVRTDDGIRKAIHTVHASRHSDRAQAYTRAQGLDAEQSLAILVQRLVRADFSGVLFTVDPVTGSYERMVGNYVRGLGEKLVAGKVDPGTFTLKRPGGRYNGQADIKRFSRKLYRLASLLERDLGGPQDIEWATVGRRLFLLQSRPISSLQGWNPVTGAWNDSLQGDFLWTNVNAGEAIPDVVTPLTWTLREATRKECLPVQGRYPFVGNIGGRIYVNATLTLAQFSIPGVKLRWLLRYLETSLGPIPEWLEIPRLSLPLSVVISALFEFFEFYRRGHAASAEVPGFLSSNVDWCRGMHRRIQEIHTQDELVSLWRRELYPYRVAYVFIMTAGTVPYIRLYGKLSRRLTKLVGETDAHTLLSNLSSDSELLASLGPVVGIAKVACGEMSQEAYLDRYGHRGPHEMELSAPRLAEDRGWLKQQLAAFNRDPIDVDALLKKRRLAFDEALRRLEVRYPRKISSLRRQLERVPTTARMREGVRSEGARLYGVIRAFALRAGDLLGLGDEVFFLTYEELFNSLSGDTSAMRRIPARKETYARYSALPSYPPIICGRFDPFRWATDPNRRNDVYDASAAFPTAVADVITGYPGAAGQVEGRVRRLDTPEAGDQLQLGEILVAGMTNVGWTPLFIRAGAVVTDVGAPLCHAAVVARELGIPAVVGCVDATTHLRTGDCVRVDGGRGTVEILRTEKEGRGE